MSKKLLGLLCVVIFACAVIVGGFTLGKDSKITRIEFPTIGGNLPDDINFSMDQGFKFTDDRLSAHTQGFTDKVYKLSLKQNSKEERVENLKKIFNMEISRKTDMGKVITFQNNNSTLDINENGTFSYTRKNTNSSKAITLSDENCIKLAENFLKEKELLPDGFFENGVAYETKTSIKNPEDSTLLKKDIYFNRKLDGKLVYGVSRIIVTVGADAQIDAVHSLYRDIDGDPATIKTKSLDEALNDLKQLKGTVRVGETAKSVNIKNVEIVYWEDSTPSSEQTHIQPVFHFKGEAIDDKGKKDDTFEAFIPAIPDSLTSESKKSQEKTIPSDEKPVQFQSKPDKGNLPKK